MISAAAVVALHDAPELQQLVARNHQCNALLWEPTPGPTGPANEPAGWFRNPTDGRRRPNGNPDLEYIRP